MAAAGLLAFNQATIAPSLHRRFAHIEKVGYLFSRVFRHRSHPRGVVDLNGSIRPLENFSSPLNSVKLLPLVKLSFEK